MKKKIVTLLLASTLVLSFSMTALADDSSDWEENSSWDGDTSNLNVTPVTPTTPGADASKGSAGGQTGASSAQTTQAATGVASSVQSAQAGQQVDAASVTVSLQNPNGSVASVDMAHYGQAVEAALNTALRGDTATRSSVVNEVTTSSALDNAAFLEKLDALAASGATARTIATVKTAAAGKDGNGNVIATPGEFTGSVSDNAAFLLTSVNADGGIERVQGVLVPVADKKKKTHNMLYGAFTGEPVTITVTVIE